MEVTDLAAQVRKEHKKGPSRRLRDKGFVPAVFYGRSAENILLAVKNDELIKLHKNKKDHAFIKLMIDDGGNKMEKLSLIKELQLQPLTGKLYHVDFYEVDEKRKITMDVSLHFIGKAVGVEMGGELQHIKREVKISCLPLDLPDHIDVDVTSLGIGDSIKIRDLKVAEGITLLDRPDTSVAAVAMVRVSKTEEAAKEEVAAEGAKAEGTEAAGTAAAPAEKEKGK
ncbi:MAG TPA: 50S ribosomal protein L25/general stress protein Ctc [Smithella sp.]|nr:50S ribosomal protein L25/general stress protein Ctc [Smithella sp.]MDM7987326.1 50S ribosomal protein L25/general stress protein Ctc [Smithella sp.]HNY51792.1 50S ribosomal protein L25/general stress protein Ctc [Smithella sp.]HOG90513.1 50S ribosomal protein L25/general stress protein Ctc [Smithella sp.]HOU50718.1 50S ribosomal protein L25/general stress protein Ctc [Smithella sp.]